MSENRILNEIQNRSQEIDTILRLITSLSKRERDVLELIAQGLSHREIAKKLGLKYSTIQGYAETVHTKLGTRNQVEAANMLKQYKGIQES